jgi:hypothetical protein
MTFEQLDRNFPNGFVDAEMTALSLDYGSRAATLHLNLRGNLPDSADSQQYGRAVLTLLGLYYFAIDPPDLDHLFYPRQLKVVFDGMPEDSEQFPLFEHLKPELPGGAFCCRFYIHDWNSFIHMAAKDAQFSWLEAESQQTG